MDSEEAAALRAQIAALTAAVTALTNAKAVPGAIGDAPLSKLRELYEDSLPPGITWRHSAHASLTPAVVYFAARPAASLARQDWTFFRDRVRARQVTIMKRLPEATTLNHEMNRWRIAFSWAVSEGLLRENPLIGIRPLKAKKHRQTEPNDNDITALRPHCDDELWAYVMLGYRRGLRGPSEARKLEWKHVDLERGRIRFTSAKSREPAP